MFCVNAAAIGQVTVVGKIVYDLTGSKLDLGLLGLAQFAPALVLVLLTGSVADRIDRRHVVAIGACLCATFTLAIGWYVGTRPTSWAPVLALVLGFGAGQAFIAPAVRSLPADMVGPDDLPRLTARVAVGGQAGIVTGPVVGGFLYVAGIRLPFFAFGALLVVGGAAALLIRPRAGAQADTPVALAAVVAEAARDAGIEAGTGAGPTTPGSGLHTAMEGLRFVRSDPVVLGAISLDLFAVLFGGAVALLPAIAKDRLGVGAVGLGWLQAANGIGAGAMTVVLAARPVGRRIGHTLLTVVAVFGVLTIVLGATRSYAVAFAAILLLSAADSVSVFIRSTLVPLATPDEMRGRVLAVENVFIGASNELGGFESGVAGQLVGTAPAVVLGGCVTVVVAAAWWVVFPALRRVDRFPTPGDLSSAGDLPTPGDLPSAGCQP